MQKFNDIYSNYFKRSYIFVKSYVHDDMVAEDIASESLIKLWHILKKNPTEKFEGLLLTILKNKSLDYLKHLAVIRKSHSEILQIYNEELDFRISLLESFDVNSVTSNEIIELYKETMNSLPARTREIFIKSRFEKKTNKELAQAYDVSVKTIEYHISKALKALRVNLKDYLPFLIFLLNL